jgi:hypothetical protein
MGSEQDKRRYSRVKWGDRATLRAGGEEATGSVLDISLNGVLVDVDLALPPGAPCDVRIPLGEAPDQAIEAEGQVARKDRSGLAIRFEAMELDSATHLRSLVTYNSDDPARMEREAHHLRLPEAGGPAVD